MTHSLATSTFFPWRLLTANEQILILWGCSELQAVGLAKIITKDLSKAGESEIEEAIILALCAAKIAASGEARVKIVFAERRDNRRAQ
jgi:hypothetical protein